MKRSGEVWLDYDSNDWINFRGDLPVIPLQRREEASKWFTKEQFEKAKETLNAPDYPDLLRDLREAVYQYHALEALEAGELVVLGAMSRQERAEYVLSVHENTVDFVGVIIKNYLPLAEVSSPDKLLKSVKLLLDLAADMKSFVINDDSFIEKPWPRKAGRPGATWHFFFQHICYIYWKATGKPPKISRSNKKRIKDGGGKLYGPFLNFARESLPLINEHVGDEAIMSELRLQRRAW